MKPLTPRMIECLAAMWSLGPYTDVTPNEIAYRAGYDDGGIRHGNGAARQGGWSGETPPSNRVNFALTGLEQRGLIRTVTRRDGRSGTARSLTIAGLQVAADCAKALDKQAGSRHRSVVKAKEAKS